MIITFATILLGGLLGTSFHWDLRKAERENRKLASFPEFNQLNLEEWPMAFETWFKDHFGFRNIFIRRYRKLMRDVGVEDYRVIYGRNEWLYLNADEIMKDFIGDLDPSEVDPKEKVRRLESRKKWLKKRGIPYLFVIAPNKASIYPEHLPSEIQKLKAKSNREAFMEQIQAQRIQYVLDLTSSLQKAKESGTIYLRTDTHWNPGGAYVGYTNIVDKMGKILDGELETLPPSSLTRSSSSFSGDLANMTVSPERYAMEIDNLTYRDKNQWGKNTIAEPEFLTKNNMPVDHKPPYTIHNPKGKYNAVIFHDSFALRLAEYLPYNFKNTTFIWKYSNLELLTLAVEHFNPTIVIEEVVERHLVDPKYGALLDDITLSEERTSHGL